MTATESLSPLRLAADGRTVEIIDQTRLPHALDWVPVRDRDAAARAIADMLVRGAPLIGGLAAWGVALAMDEDTGDAALAEAIAVLGATRPTAVNLRWALERMETALKPLAPAARADAAIAEAASLCEEDVAINSTIGDHGLALFQQAMAAKRGDGPLNVLTHCNAGWLACLGWGTATAPIYKAHAAGMDIHVWVDETRPRNQGAALTAWELGQASVKHTVIVDNAGGHLMQRGLVDLCITGTDRVAANGDVCNKIGTYLKALAAREAGIPFYVACPSPTIDWRLIDGMDIPIEERSTHEVTHLAGETEDGRVETVRITPTDSPAANPAFDVTPATLVTAIVTERGAAKASGAGLAKLFPECPERPARVGR